MLAIRLSRRLTRAAFHSSAGTLARKNKKIRPIYAEDLKDFNVSTHLHKELQASLAIDWEKLRVSIIGLPVDGKNLVTKVNVDTVIWEEIIKFGCVEKALDYVSRSGMEEGKSQSGLIRLLRDLVTLQF